MRKRRGRFSKAICSLSLLPFLFRRRRRRSFASHCLLTFTAKYRSILAVRRLVFPLVIPLPAAPPLPSPPVVRPSNKSQDKRRYAAFPRVRRPRRPPSFVLRRDPAHTSGDGDFPWATAERSPPSRRQSVSQWVDCCQADEGQRELHIHGGGGEGVWSGGELSISFLFPSRFRSRAK